MACAWIEFSHACHETGIDARTIHVGKTMSLIAGTHSDGFFFVPNDEFAVRPGTNCGVLAISDGSFDRCANSWETATAAGRIVSINLSQYRTEVSLAQKETNGPQLRNLTDSTPARSSGTTSKRGKQMNKVPKRMRGYFGNVRRSQGYKRYHWIHLSWITAPGIRYWTRKLRFFAVLLIVWVKRQLGLTCS